MLCLKAKNDEDHRQFFIHENIKIIYEAAIRTAETTTETSYRHPLLDVSNRSFKHDAKRAAEAQLARFQRTNIVAILEGLHSLFSDCRIEYKIPTPSYKTDSTHDYIIIDWS